MSLPRAGGGRGSAAARERPSGAGKPLARRPSRQRSVARDVASELAEAVPSRRFGHFEHQLAEATRAYERDRYPEALAILRSLAKAAPGVASIRELLGLTLYRLGRWRESLKELVAFVEMTGSVDQHPVLMDAQRALGGHDEVERLFAELRRTGAGSDVLAEGRLVMAGDLADRGDIPAAVALLAPVAARPVQNPQDRHIRQWFALADLFERSGDVPRARELFRRVVLADPEISDAPERLAGLR